MVKALFIYGDGKYSITVKGHACTAKSGEPDIVCAAASMLTYTLAQNAVDMAQARLLTIDRCKLDPGDAEIAFTTQKGHEASADMISSAIFRGYELLAAQYPKAVKAEKYCSGET